jgi:fatty-acyl-CoA synthase
MVESGEVVTHAELDERSSRAARVLHDAGLRPGDHLALFSENNARYHEVVWGALRSGLVLTPVNTHLNPGEAAYIVDNCDAQALIVSARLGDSASQLLRGTPRCTTRLMMGGTSPGFEPYDEAAAAASGGSLPPGPRGDLMLYSSGTTGRPKGIRRASPTGSIRDGLAIASRLRTIFGFDADTVYLSPAPLYHAAPLGFTVGTQSLGGTAVVMSQFDPAGALAAIERHRVTTSQWVPTMFSRMLALTDTDRNRFDLSSHRMAIHAAAPCPRTVKEAMLDWWGPVIHEYYGSTEGNGLTYCTPQEWLEHPGSVGCPVSGELHICDERGRELAHHNTGTVYFEQPSAPFDYHKDPEQTRATRHPVHPRWTTLGDVGWADEDGYLYLTDRATFVIISGGVNIYPREVEDCLITHDDVEDVAVFGIPDPDLGEQVKAVVQLRSGVHPAPELAAELISYTRDRLSHFKCPKSVDFQNELPRLPTGKLQKGPLRDRYRRKPPP